MPDESVRAAAARDLRPPARIARDVPAGCDGESARRSVAEWRAELGGGARRARHQASPVRQVSAAPWPQDGAPHGTRRDARGRPPTSDRGARIALTTPCHTASRGWLRVNEPLLLRRAPSLQILDVPLDAIRIAISDVDALQRIGVEIEEARAPRVDREDRLQRTVAEPE